MPEQLTISEALNILESDEKKLIDLCAKMAKAHDGDFYPFDIFASGAANRSIALSVGFRTMIRDKNLICAGALLRLQLDTAFRFFAGFIVKDPHQFAKDVLAGKQIRKFTDMEGKKLTDKYLVDSLAKEFPWAKSIYEKTCDYIHFSGTHLSHAINVKESLDGNKTFACKIGAVDREFPDQTYLDAIIAFQQSTLIFVLYLNGWIYTKDNPEAIVKLKAKRDAASNAT